MRKKPDTPLLLSALTTYDVENLCVSTGEISASISTITAGRNIDDSCSKYTTSCTNSNEGRIVLHVDNEIIGEKGTFVEIKRYIAIGL
jgi:hypothetical protein